MNDTRWDLLTFGESMLRLTPTNGQRVQDAAAFRATVGGTESNVCVALTQLGRTCAWLSALPTNVLGQRVAHEIGAHGVDVSRVIWTDDRLGLYFLEPGVAPRPARVLYDRANSAVAMLDPMLIDADVVTRARVVHLTGITPALSTTAATICTRLAERATAAGVPLSVDVNYRARLWDPATARAGLAGLLQHATLLFCGAADAATIWGHHGSAADVAAALLAHTGAQIAIVTDGGAGATARTRDGQIMQQVALPVQIVDPVGAGDAFAAGVLHAWLDHPTDLAAMLRSGTALAALKMTVNGDHALTNAAELAETIASIDATAPRDIDR